MITLFKFPVILNSPGWYDGMPVYAEGIKQEVDHDLFPIPHDTPYGIQPDGFSEYVLPQGSGDGHGMGWGYASGKGCGSPREEML